MEEQSLQKEQVRETSVPKTLGIYLLTNQLGCPCSAFDLQKHKALIILSRV